MQRFTFYFLLIWPFIWDNATQRYHNAQLLAISKSLLQVTEIGVIMLILFYVLFRNVHLRLDKRFLPFIVMMILLSIFSGLINRSYTVGIIQVAYILVRPFLIFFIITNLGLSRVELVKAVRFYFFMLGLNAVVNIAQFVFQGVVYDDAGGLMYHSHTLANFLTLGILWILSLAFLTRKYRYTIWIMLFFPPIIIGAHEKTIVLLVPILLVMYILVSSGGSKRYAPVLLILVTFGFGAYTAVSRFLPTTIEVTRLAILNIDKLGAVRAYSTLFEVFQEHKSAAIYGLGPGNYGSIFNTIGSGASARRKKDYAWEIYYASTEAEETGKRKGVWEPKSNLYLAVLSEYGLVGLGLFIWAIYSLALELLRIYRSKVSDIQLRWIALGTLLAFLYTMEMGSIYLQSGYSSQSNIYPIIIIAALLHVTVLRGEQLPPTNLRPDVQSMD